MAGIKEGKEDNVAGGVLLVYALEIGYKILQPVCSSSVPLLGPTCPFSPQLVLPYPSIPFYPLHKHQPKPHLCPYLHHSHIRCNLPRWSTLLGVWPDPALPGICTLGAGLFLILMIDLHSLVFSCHSYCWLVALCSRSWSALPWGMFVCYMIGGHVCPCLAGTVCCIMT